MTYIDALILGFVQGITEFFPISSSGHLVVTEALLNIHVDPLSMQGFNVLLHAGTLIALLCCYARRWKEILLSPFTKNYANQRLLFFLILASIPAAISGLIFDERIAAISSLPVVGVSFLITAAVLIYGERRSNGDSIATLTYKDIALIGIAQACALVPGISRSGFTISAGRMAGLKREEALDFSFLMATPIIAGATMLAMIDVLEGSITLPASQTMIMGVAVSFVLSALSIVFLRSIVARYSFAWFAVYLIPLGLLCLTYRPV